MFEMMPDAGNPVRTNATESIQNVGVRTASDRVQWRSSVASAPAGAPARAGGGAASPSGS